MRIILAGTPSLVLPIFQTIYESEIEIVTVLTNPPKPRGRSVTLQPSPVSQWARERGLPVYEESNLEGIRNLLPTVDLVLVVAYGQLIKKDFLSLPQYGWVNIHFSHLPEARGAAPVQRLIEAGAKEIGFTVFRLDQGMDTGPIFYRSEAVPVLGLTTGQVWETLVARAKDEITRVLMRICDGQKPSPQEEYLGRLPLAPKISTAETQIMWNQPSDQVISKILAFNPSPSAWTTLRGERFLIHRAELAEFPDDSSGLKSQQITPGEIIQREGSLLVRTGSGFIRVLEVQASGKRKMETGEWVRGNTLNIGKKFE